MDIPGHKLNTVFSDMSANENSPSVGLDLYNEANIYIFV